MSSSVVGRLQHQLREQLAATVSSVCSSFEQELEQATQETDVSAINFVTYRTCCRQLVAYMATQMTTSPDFVRQMDKVILASHTNTAGRVLESLVQEDVWVRYEREGRAEQEGAGKREINAVTPTGSTSSPVVDLTRVTPPTSRGRKRRGSDELPHPKRRRHAVARALYGGEEVVEVSSQSETETEREEQEQNESGALVWPCSSGDPRQRSRGFQHHLQNALRLVDAENCSPPPAMVCTKGCDTLRSQMCEKHRVLCNDATPCHDTTCSVWRVVDMHTVRCHHSHCEFKNRVGLRKATYLIRQKTAEMDAVKAKLDTLKATLHDTEHRSVPQNDFAAIDLDEKIKKLEDELDSLSEGIALHEERVRVFRSDLSAIGAQADPDDQPGGGDHYVVRRLGKKGGTD